MTRRIRSCSIRWGSSAWWPTCWIRQSCRRISSNWWVWSWIVSIGIWVNSIARLSGWNGRTKWWHTGVGLNLRIHRVVRLRRICRGRGCYRVGSWIVSIGVWDGDRRLHWLVLSSIRR